MTNISDNVVKKEISIKKTPSTRWILYLGGSIGIGEDLISGELYYHHMLFILGGQEEREARGQLYE